jgi:hypothetical protein
VHRIDLEIALAIGLENELRTVRRPGRVGILGGVVRQAEDVRAVEIHGVDLEVSISVGMECNLASGVFNLGVDAAVCDERDKDSENENR